MSCSDDFISKNPPSDLNSEGFYKTETDMNQAVLSAYANLRSLYNQTYVRLGEIRSDNTTYSWLSGNPANEKGIDEFSSPLLPENNFLASCLDDIYKTILRCNIVIGRIENIESSIYGRSTIPACINLFLSESYIRWIRSEW